MYWCHSLAFACLQNWVPPVKQLLWATDEQTAGKLGRQPSRPKLEYSNQVKIDLIITQTPSELYRYVTEASSSTQSGLSCFHKNLQSWQWALLSPAFSYKAIAWKFKDENYKWVSFRKSTSSLNHILHDYHKWAIQLSMTEFIIKMNCALQSRCRQRERVGRVLLKR